MKLAKTILTIAVVGFTAAANADLFYGFNTDVEGFQNVSWQATSPVGWPGIPTIKQTHAAGGWQSFLTKEFSWGPGGGSANQQLEMQALANQGDNAHFAFDVMVDGTSFPAGVAGWYQFTAIGNSDGTAGWTQKEDLFKGVATWHNADDPALLTLHIDQPFSFFGWQPGDTWFQFWTVANSDASMPVNFFLDNVHAYVVPEPTAFALAGLGAAVLMIFRRK